MQKPLDLELALSAPRVYLYYLTGWTIDPDGYLIEHAPLEFPKHVPRSLLSAYDRPVVQDFIRIVLTRPDLRESNYLDHAKADWCGLPDFMKTSLFDGFQKYVEEDYAGALNCFNEAVQKEPHNGYALVLRAFTNFRLKNRAAAETDYNDAFKYQWRVTTAEPYQPHSTGGSR